MRMTNRFRLSIVLSLFILSFSPAFAAPQISEPPQLQGFDAFATSVMAEWKVPGLAIAVVQDGKIVYARGFGYRDLDKKLPVTPHTIFGIGSCSKAFTATTMGILVDEGKLEWDKPVREYLPTFRLSDEVATDRVTPRDLMTHRTGLPRHDNVWIRSELTRQQMFDALHTLEFSRDIRQTYQYNNLMVMTAGYLVGTIAGLVLGGLRPCPDPRSSRHGRDRTSRPTILRKRPISRAPTRWSRGRSRNSPSTTPMRSAPPARSTRPSWTWPPGS